MPDTKTNFQNICDTDLNDEAMDWDGYYQSLAPYLTNDDPDIRAQCIEELITAVFWSEEHGVQNKCPTIEHMAERTEWLLNLFLNVQKTQPNTLSTVLNSMRYTFPYDDALRQMVLNFLNLLLETSWPQVETGMIRGTIILHHPVNAENEQEQFSEWLKLLDDPSDYVRACAAYRIGGTPDDHLMPIDDLMELIKQKDIQRPGIAGPFWSEAQYIFENNIDFGMHWMMDILEQRKAPPSKDNPFNDIVFHLHEICDHSPDMVRRMIKGGHIALAIETALETHGVVDGMAPVLRDLGWDKNKQIVHRIARHLACYYQEVHPNAGPYDIKRLPNWHEHADLFLLRFFLDSADFDCAVIYCTANTGYFTDKQAWAIVDKIFPPTARGFLKPDFLAFNKHLPPNPRILGDKANYLYEEHDSVAMYGDPENRLWSRIEVHSKNLYFPKNVG